MRSVLFNRMQYLSIYESFSQFTVTLMRTFRSNLNPQCRSSSAILAQTDSSSVPSSWKYFSPTSSLAITSLRGRYDLWPVDPKLTVHHSPLSKQWPHFLTTSVLFYSCIYSTYYLFFYLSIYLFISYFIGVIYLIYSSVYLEY